MSCDTAAIEVQQRDLTIILVCSNNAVIMQDPNTDSNVSIRQRVRRLLEGGQRRKCKQTVLTEKLL